MADQFEVELQHLVTRVARDLAQEITSLILRRLGIDEARAGRGGGGGRSRGAAVVMSQALRRATRGGKRSAAPVAAKGKRSATRTRATTEERAAILEQIQRIVAGAEGLSVGEVERKSGLPRPSVASALKALKDQGRLFMGGTKRFARYATTQAVADHKSHQARGGA